MKSLSLEARTTFPQGHAWTDMSILPHNKVVINLEQFVSISRKCVRCQVVFWSYAILSWFIPGAAPVVLRHRNWSAFLSWSLASLQEDGRLAFMHLYWVSNCNRVVLFFALAACFEAQQEIEQWSDRLDERSSSVPINRQALPPS